MDLRALNDKIRLQLPSLTGEAREKVQAEVIARERFLEDLEVNLEVECICGLTMPKASLLEHLKETRVPWESNRHGLKTDARQSKKTLVESDDVLGRRKLFKFSTSNTISGDIQADNRNSLELGDEEKGQKTISASGKAPPSGKIRAKRRSASPLRKVAKHSD